MRKGLLGSVAALLASTGVALAQTAAPGPAIPPPGPASPPPAIVSTAPGCRLPDPLAACQEAYASCPTPIIEPGLPQAPAEEPPANDVCMPYHCFIGAEYLHMWMRGVPTPPLLTTGTPDSRGIIGVPGTQVLVGSNTFSGLQEDGYRLTLGMWLDQCSTIEFSYFFMNEGSGVAASSATNPVLARPFINAATGLPDAAGLSLPGLVTGGVQVLQDSQFWGGEVNLRQKNLCGKHFNLDVLLGVRYLELDESLVANENLVPTTGGLGATAQDDFATRNRFYGGQFGVEAEWDYGPFFVNARAKVALGAAVEEVAIRGSTIRTGTATPTTVQGGFLALGTNIGSHSQNRFSAAPEGGFNVGCMFTEWLRASVGYNVLYITDVVRPGNQIDPTINTGGSAIPAKPSFAFKESDFWVQGLTVSVEVRF